MSVYTVHEPPQRDAGAAAEPDRFVLVRDGFHVWAMVFGPLWLLWRGLWLALLFYVIAWIGVQGGFWFLKAGAGAQTAIGFAFALLLGMEASTLWRWTLNRNGWKNVGVVVGDDLESAERRFFQSWREGSAVAAAAAAKPAVPAGYAVKKPDSASDVIGLFPEPGGPR